MGVSGALEQIVNDGEQGKIYKGPFPAILGIHFLFFNPYTAEFLK